jgi:7-cyano-7-deazaguanine synthase in queuosine biosynthesis
VISSRLFLCSGAKIAPSDPLAAGRQRINLDSIGKKANVHIRFENVAKVFHQHLSPRLVDFLEIASYVYSADCATSRGKAWTDDDSTEPWGRDLAFVIPVREPDFWNSSEVTDLIIDVLTFLSNDKYSFTFVRLEHDRTDQQQYLEYGELEDWPFYATERVIMFSGGLDSLAGAVETARAGERLVLVSHRPVAMLDSRQRQLFSALKKEFPNQLIHIPVWINKSEKLGRREPTQRTRSFLYSALGTVVAQSVQAGGVQFFENGIVSLNLPVADEAIRARASRTTHPVALQLLESLCSAVTERDFAVDNPYIFKTKTDVATILSANKAAHLIPYTCSCAHSMFKSKTQWHCGSCSQCIDRRFAITAAGLLAYDSDADYVSDVFLGPRRDGPEKSMAVDYTRHGIELWRRSESELAARFNAELSRAVRYEPKRSEAAERIISMHKRHGEVVTRVLQEKVVEQAAKLVEGTVDNSSLLSLVLGKKHLECQGQPVAEPEKDEPTRSRSATKSGSEAQPQNVALAKVEELLQALLARFDSVPAPEPIKKGRNRRNPGKRDTVVFAAILAGFKGTRYCSFLDKYGTRPKWSDSGPATYLKSYQVGHPWRKKVQDEKTRAKLRMQGYPRSELATALSTYLPGEFDKISPLLVQLASRE